MTYDLGAFYDITDIHFGGVYLVLNVEGSCGVQGSSIPPPFAIFTFKLPKDAKLISQQIISQQQQSSPGGTVLKPIYTFWSSKLSLPTALTYNISMNALNGGVRLPFPLSFNSGLFDYGNQFSTQFVDSSGTLHFATGGLLPGYYGSLGDALTGAAFANGGSGASDIRMYSSDGSNQFQLPPNSWSVITLGVPFTQQPSASSATNTVFIFSIPVTATVTMFTSSVPAGGQTVGWASVFTNQKKAIKTRADLTGLADQSIYFPVNLASISLNITTTGATKKGTVSIPGGIATAPLAPDAPPQPPGS